MAGVIHKRNRVGETQINSKEAGGATRGSSNKEVGALQQVNKRKKMEVKEVEEEAEEEEEAEVEEVEETEEAKRIRAEMEIQMVKNREEGGTSLSRLRTMEPQLKGAGVPLMDRLMVKVGETQTMLMVMVT